MRTECIECGAELWGPCEGDGVCLTCQRRSWDEEDAERFGDEDEATTSEAKETR